MKWLNFYVSRYFYYLFFQHELIVVSRLTKQIVHKRIIDDELSNLVKTYDNINGLHLIYGSGNLYQLMIGNENKNSWTHLVALGREQEALSNCELEDPDYVSKLRRIVGDSFYKKQKYDDAVKYYFNSELSFEEVMRLIYKLFKQDNQLLFAESVVKFLKTFIELIPDKGNIKNKELRIKVIIIFLLEICSYNYSKLKKKSLELENEENKNVKEISFVQKKINFFSLNLEFILNSNKEYLDEKIARQILESHNCFDLMNHLAKKNENFEYCVNFYMRKENYAKATGYIKYIIEKILGKLLK